MKTISSHLKETSRVAYNFLRNLIKLLLFGREDPRLAKSSPANYYFLLSGREDAGKILGSVWQEEENFEVLNSNFESFEVLNLEWSNVKFL